MNDDIQAIVKERGERYGDLLEQATVSQLLQQTLCDALLGNDRYQALPKGQQFVIAQFLDLTALKLSRVVTGDPTYDDNYTDIEGYSKITRERVCKPRSE